MRIRTLYFTALMLVFLVGATVAGAQSNPPRLFFTDLDSGPNSGGETVGTFSGAYVTVYGNFFGASQGSSSITWNNQNCLRVVGPTGSYTGWGMSRFWYQEIIVQFGASCAAGTGNIVVTVNGQPSNGLPYTVRGGNIYFVSTSGSDSNAGSFAAPFKTLPNARDKLKAGDVLYAENGVAQPGDDGQGWRADFTLSNNGVNGTAGNPIAVVAYPGATVTIGGPSGANFGIRTPGGGLGSYWTIAGLTLIGRGDGAFATDGPATNMRAIANSLTDPVANGQDGGCITLSQTPNSKVLGNECTGVFSGGGGGTANKEQHAVYITTDNNHTEVAWNRIHDNHSCRALQFHSSPLGSGSGFNMYDLHAHDNLIYNDPCDGINFATVDPSQGVVEAYNNVIYHVGIGPDPQGGESGDYSCIFFAYITNTGAPGGGVPQIYNNTLYDCGPHPGSYGASGAFMFNGGNSSLVENLTNNLVVQLPGENYIGTSTGAGTYKGTNNLWFGLTGSAPSVTTGNITANPQLLNALGFDFHLQPASPAVGAGTASQASLLDRDGLVRPSPPSIGAYEYTGTGNATKPAPPTNVTLVVH